MRSHFSWTAVLWSLLPCDRVLCELQIGELIRPLHFEHPVASFRRPARLRHDDDQRAAKLSGQFAQHRVDPVGIGVVDEERQHRVIRRPECLRDELRSQRRASNADDQRKLKLARVPFDLPVVNVMCELRDRRARLINLSRDLVGRSQRRVPQPVVPDHPLLVRVGDGPTFECRHRIESLRHSRQQRREITLLKPHTADIEREPKSKIGDEVLTVALPSGGHLGHPSDGNVRRSGGRGVACGVAGVGVSPPPDGDTGEQSVFRIAGGREARTPATRSGGYDIAGSRPSRASSHTDRHLTIRPTANEFTDDEKPMRNLPPRADRDDSQRIAVRAVYALDRRCPLRQVPATPGRALCGIRADRTTVIAKREACMM